MSNAETSCVYFCCVSGCVGVSVRLCLKSEKYKIQRVFPNVKNSQYINDKFDNQR